MGKDELKTLSEILADKRKFRRITIIIGMVLFTLVVIAVAGFYLGAITYNG